MPLGTQIASHLPYLRRYARALTGSQPAGDDLVRATLEAALAQPDLRAALGTGRAALYRAFTAIWTESHPDVGEGRTGTDGGKGELAVQARLATITPLSRQALLLTALEGFTAEEAGQVIGRPAEAVLALAEEAKAEIARQSATRVLIIEDEPLIAMQLEDLVRRLGHDLCCVAATRNQAVREAARCRPGLVLADIQLADGSSGLDAVDDIQAQGEVPVVVITAFPERLLTGNRAEPTYLVTKPFREEAVRATIAQALFFRAPALS